MERVGRNKGIRPEGRRLGCSSRNKLPAALANQQTVQPTTNHAILPEIAGSEGSWQLGQQAAIKAGGCCWLAATHQSRELPGVRGLGERSQILLWQGHDLCKSLSFLHYWDLSTRAFMGKHRQSTGNCVGNGHRGTIKVESISCCGAQEQTLWSFFSNWYF